MTTITSTRRLLLCGSTLLALVALLPANALAAPAFVKNLPTAANRTLGTTIFIDTPVLGVAAGNTLIVSFAMDDVAGAVTCSDAKGNSYSTDQDVTDAGDVRTVVCSAHITTALVSGDDITVTHPSATAKAMSVSEFSGLLSTGRLDQTTTKNETDNDMETNATAATTQASELAIGVFGWEGRLNQDFNDGTNYTVTQVGSTGNAGGADETHISVGTEYRILTSTGTQEATASIDIDLPYAALIVTYKASVCGDNITSSGEQCDDGNTSNGDCCSSTCQFESAATTCRTAAGECDVAETCTGSSATCPADALRANGFACGSGSDTECDNPDTCDGSGSCIVNNEPALTACGDTGTECVNQDTCDGSGSCTDNGFVPADTSCGDGSDTECDDPDTCDGAGSCDANLEAPTTPCGDAGADCVLQDFCNGAGACADSGFAGAGTSCGSGSDTECDNPDSCNGSGSCVANNEPAETTCGDAGTECVNQDTCDGGGSCTDNGFAPADTNCGDAGTECVNQDTCDGAGTCDDNGFVAAETACGDGTDTECDNPDTCDGAGACEANPEPAETACGDAGTECTNQDTCDGAGTCDDNGFAPADTNCGDAGTECTNQDTCDGAGTCDDNGFVAAETSCGDGTDTECDNPDTCDGAGACATNTEPEETACGDTGTECTNQDTCDGLGECTDNGLAPADTSCGDAGTECTNQDTCDGAGTCDDNGFVAAETSCGDGTDTECDNPDTCNGSGSCVVNNEPAETNCGDAGTECTNQDTCDGGGSCSDNGFASSGTSCGDGSDSECDNPDSCNGSGSCVVNNEPAETSCGDAGTECVTQDTCDGGGSCTDNGFASSGASCGDGTETECDNPDTCDGAGACEDNLEPAETTCGDAGTECTNQDFCDGDGSCADNGFAQADTNCGDDGTECTNQDTCDGAGTCDDNGFVAAETACGDDTDTECNNPDTCDGAGACAPNLEPEETACGDAGTECTKQDTCDGLGECTDNGFTPADTNCGDAGTECTNQDTCDGAGTCDDNGFVAAETACGDDADTECDNPDTCDGAGECALNLETPGTNCGDAGTECTNQDTCDASGLCQDNGFATAGTSCGDGSDSICDDPDTCDGAGACEVNTEPTETECRPSEGDCDFAEFCDGAGACPADSTETEGAPCGDPSESECDHADTCDASGVCQTNLAAAEAPCGDAGTECTNQDTCDGAGTCDDNGFVAAETACGDDTDSDCDNPDTCDGGGACEANYELAGTGCGDDTESVCDHADTCDGTGTCELNYEADDFECRPSAGECDEAELCDGAGTCPADVFADNGTACGDPSDTDCDNPDTCDGGACATNPEPVTTTCRSADGLCDVAENCDGAGACRPDGVADEIICRGADGACDVAEQCDGLTKQCPADAVADEGTVCGESGECAGAGTCDGTTKECSVDVTDTDGDGICDDADDCPNDAANDVDGDGLCADEDNCPVNANPSQANTDADGFGDACDYLCIAPGVDPSGVFTGAMTSNTLFTGGADADATLDSISSSLLFANSATNASGATNDKVSFAINLPGTGPWFASGRFYYPSAPASNGANSFLLRIDNSAVAKFGNNLNLFQTFHWDGDGNTETNAPDVLSLGSLTAGAHTLTILKREVTPTPPRLDLVCLSPSGAVPTDAVICAAAPEVCGGGTTTTSTTTTTTTTSTTLPPAGDLVCVAAAAPGAVFAGQMTTSTTFTGGADADPVRDNMTTPLVFANSNTNSVNGGSGSTVSYVVSLPSTDTWFLWGRFYYPGTPGSNDANSFLARVDGGTRKKFGNNLDFFRTWHWGGDGNAEHGAPTGVPFGTLAAGNHTLLVEKREVVPIQPRLDVLCFSKNGTSAPTDGEVCVALGLCGGTTTSTTSTTNTTTTSTTSTTLESPINGICVAAGGTLPPGTFAGAMTTGTQFTGGADLDPASNNLTSPLVFANSTTNSSNGGSGDQVSYVVSLPSTGTWFLWGRFYYPGAPGSNDANSFLARVNGGTRKKFGNNLDFFRTWHWGGDGNAEHGAPAAVPLGTLSAGNHTLLIEKREVVTNPPRLDMFCITNDGVNPPTDGQACDATDDCE